MKNFSILMLALAFCLFTQGANAQDKTPAKPKILDEKTWTWEPTSEFNYANFKDMTFEVGMGNEKNGVGIAEVGLEIETAQRISVTVAASPFFTRHDDNSFAGFMVDYHTAGGYTKRVALPMGFYSQKKWGKNPVWGTVTVPDQFVDQGKKKEYNLDLKKWAPEGWDGKVWFSVSLQNSGRNTYLKGTVQLVGGQEKVDVAQKPKEEPGKKEGKSTPTFVPLDISDAATVASTRIFNQESLAFPQWGKQTHHGVPFVVNDPDGGKTKNAICLYSPLGAVSSKMPNTVRLGCDLSAKEIHVLGAAGWGVPWFQAKNTLSMVMRVEYADGDKEDHQVINGVHLTDWAKGPDVPGSKNIGVSQVRYFSIVPKRQDAVIRAIEFRKGTDKTSPLVMALTVESFETQVAQKPKEEPGKTKDDKALLQGRWYAVYEESGGKALSKAEVVKLEKILVVSGDDFRIERPVSILAGQISLRQTDAPKRFDFSGKVANSNYEMYGVYEVSQDTLKLCYTSKLSTRPLEFRTTPESGSRYVIFKRTAEKVEVAQKPKEEPAKKEVTDKKYDDRPFTEIPLTYQRPIVRVADKDAVAFMRNMQQALGNRLPTGQAFELHSLLSEHRGLFYYVDILEDKVAVYAAFRPDVTLADDTFVRSVRTVARLMLASPLPGFLDVDSLPGIAPDGYVAWDVQSGYDKQNNLAVAIGSYTFADPKDKRPLSPTTLGGKTLEEAVRSKVKEVMEKAKKASTEQLTADYLPFNPGMVRYYDIQTVRYESPEVLQRGEGTVLRVQVTQKADGIIESAITNTGSVKGNRRILDNAKVQWENQLRQSPPVIEFYRRNDNHVEIGWKATEGGEPVWEPMLKIGARDGEAWQWKTDVVQVRCTLLFGETHMGRPAAKVIENRTITKPVPATMIIWHTYVKGVGEVERSTAITNSSNRECMQAVAKLMETANQKIEALESVSLTEQIRAAWKIAQGRLPEGKTLVINKVPVKSLEPIPGAKKLVARTKTISKDNLDQDFTQHLQHLVVSATKNQLVVDFDVDREKWQPVTRRFSLLVRLFDKNGQYLTHVVSPEDFTASPEVFAGWMTVVNRMQGLPPAAKADLLGGFNPKLLKANDNRLIFYNVNPAVLQNAAIVEVGFILVPKKAPF